MARRALILIEGDTGNGPLYLQAAQRLGLHPITLSADPARYDYLAFDGAEVITVDTDNIDALIRECCRIRAGYHIAGITGFVGDDELVYATVGKLCQYFDLPGPNPAAVERCCDKFVQRQLLGKAGVPMPAYRLAANATDVENAAAEIGLPVIVKPTVGCGSIGVRLCRNFYELAEHAAHLLRGKHSSPRILVEEFAEGPYYVADIMGYNVIAIAAGEFLPPPHFVWREETLPAQLTNDQHERIADVSLRSLRALGLGWGPTNIGFRWTKSGPVVIEANPRISGAPDPQLVQLAFGMDPITEHVKLVIGMEWDISKRKSHIAAMRYLVPDRDGILDWTDADTDEASRAAAASGAVVEFKKYLESKTAIVRKGDYRDAIGHIICASSTHAQTARILQGAADSFSWSIAPFPDSCIR
ncbi:ATP-grasp domain-containing protein [Mesorhizobium sp. ORM8.1]